MCKVRLYYNYSKSLLKLLMNNKVDYLFPDEEYRPKTADMDKIKHYVNVE